jgi:hypothetical protein
VGCTAVSFCTCALLSAVALAPALTQARSPSSGNPPLTFDLSTTGSGRRGADYRNLRCVYRLDPHGSAQSGFYLAGRGDVHHLSSRLATGAFVGFGFELGYTWLLGSDRDVSVTIGAAAALSGGVLTDFTVFGPTLRLVPVGWEGRGLR